jgi:hypothetical protein
MDYYDQMKRGATDFQSVMGQLRQAGLNDTAMKDIFAQGVDGLNYAKAILEGGSETVDFINTTMKDIQEIGVATGSVYAKQYEPSYQGPYDYKQVITSGMTQPTPASAGAPPAAIVNMPVNIEINTPITSGTLGEVHEYVRDAVTEALGNVVSMINIKVGQ